jgi:hypothetical protein
MFTARQPLRFARRLRLIDLGLALVVGASGAFAQSPNLAAGVVALAGFLCVALAPMEVGP